jgi:hypothetical protein
MRIDPEDAGGSILRDPRDRTDHGVLWTSTRPDEILRTLLKYALLIKYRGV